MRRPAPISWMLTIVLCVLTIPLLMAAQVPTNRPLYPGEQWVTSLQRQGPDRLGRSRQREVDGGGRHDPRPGRHQGLRLPAGPRRSTRISGSRSASSAKATATAASSSTPISSPARPTSARACSSRSTAPSTTIPAASTATAGVDRLALARIRSRSCARPIGTSTC